MNPEVLWVGVGIGGLGGLGLVWTEAVVWTWWALYLVGFVVVIVSVLLGLVE